MSLCCLLWKCCSSPAFRKGLALSIRRFVALWDLKNPAALHVHQSSVWTHGGVETTVEWNCCCKRKQNVIAWAISGSPSVLLGTNSFFCLVSQGIYFIVKSYLTKGETCKSVFSDGDLYYHEKKDMLHVFVPSSAIWLSCNGRKLIIVRGHNMTKIARVLGLAFVNENLEAVLIRNSDCSHWSGLKLNFTHWSFQTVLWKRCFTDDLAFTCTGSLALMGAQ